MRRGFLIYSKTREKIIFARRDFGTCDLQYLVQQKGVAMSFAEGGII